ncbi:imidazolonepropionase [Marinoscillum sp. MHG1-6]|uniref:imidazolonepropionase n=1 Tax=Marinoscillum sp. MHG1-6 TaxID=2959627 RepID=UPI0021570E92|nr:imidazolonepropionase [Marinoscillum sp. MHG1-6]
MEQNVLIGPLQQLVTMNGLPPRGPMSDSDLEVIENAGILIQGNIIKKIDSFEKLRSGASEIEQIDGVHVAIPGLIDAHTHICFAGSRAQDYAMRNAGLSYLEIARAGGGIWDTVQVTRQASQHELTSLTIERARKMFVKGVTTIEVKSGYGLTIEHELKMLRAIREANKHSRADLIPTCLAAHICPKDFAGTLAEYLDYLAEVLLPILKEESLTRRIDAFIEDGAFSPALVTAFFQKAIAMGFELTVHADQFHTGGSSVAIQLKARSADHLEASGDDEIVALANSDVIATALPGASIGLGCDFAPARKILDLGGKLAIASDWNPGSAPMGDLLCQASILGSFQKLTNAEVLAGITYRAAEALGLEDRGKVSPGNVADLCLFPTKDYREILYHQGMLHPDIVFKSGQMVTMR